MVNTVKIAGAAIVAVVIAQLLGLEFAVSAGIVAILTIQPTKKETIKTAASRLYAFVAALVISYACFACIGFRTEAFFVYLILFIFLCQRFGWYSAMAMDSVLISHFLSLSNMEIEAVVNEAGIFIIGVGIGILFNLHLRKNVSYMERLKEETDEQIKRALHRMAERILDKDLSDYDGSCFQEMGNSIMEAKKLARANYLNQFDSKDTMDMEYIAMREKQIHVLYEMYKEVSNIHTKPVTAQIISDFLENMSVVYHRGNSGEELLKEFYQMNESMKAAPLPVAREEFEDRAKLYILLRNIEEFLLLKKEFADKYLRKNNTHSDKDSL